MGVVTHKYKGVKGIKNIAKEFGVSQRMIHHRMQQGMTLAEAVEMPMRERKSYVYRGARGLNQISKLTGIPFQALKYRVNIMGMGIKQAVKDAKDSGEKIQLKEEQIKIKFSASSRCPKPHYSPLKALAFGLITREQYDEATKQ